MTSDVDKLRARDEMPEAVRDAYDDALMEFGLDQVTAMTAYAKALAREEIASLMGLWLRRLQSLPHKGELNTRVVLNHLVGEALRDFSATPDEPGPKTVELGGGIKPEGEVSA